MHVKGIDVVDRRCFKRSCYALGFDKGTFVQGRGYTSYYDKPRKVCQTRHLHGCPIVAVCRHCRACLVENQKQHVCGPTLSRIRSDSPSLLNLVVNSKTKKARDHVKTGENK
jgi:hypothetical protein